MYCERGCQLTASFPPPPPLHCTQHSVQYGRVLAVRGGRGGVRLRVWRGALLRACLPAGGLAPPPPRLPALGSGRRPGPWPRHPRPENTYLRR